MTTTTPVLTFSTRAEAQSHIDALDAASYHLAHGEYARPHYTARKVRGDDSYYIHAQYSYYSGTFHARKNGALLTH